MTFVKRPGFFILGVSDRNYRSTSALWRTHRRSASMSNGLHVFAFPRQVTGEPPDQRRTQVRVSRQSLYHRLR